MGKSLHAKSEASHTQPHSRTSCGCACPQQQPRELVAKNLHAIIIDSIRPFGPEVHMGRNYFTEAEAQALVGQRVKRDEVIGEVKGYEYIADIEEEEGPYGAYSLLILWDGGTTEKVNKAAYRQGVEEQE